MAVDCFRIISRYIIQGGKVSCRKTDSVILPILWGGGVEGKRGQWWWQGGSNLYRNFYILRKNGLNHNIKKMLLFQLPISVGQN